ncbi:sciellin isoform X3 [Phyllopteryx taeniolatus]|uniref:sciellin isoform X3 n=1 Tax=Phyllopteryx taeniolatus TaxID=161469 RepID=UPI002AD50955|nr:sciellin isoform X3 [Phyllopteryx taeniolatus]
MTYQMSKSVRTSSSSLLKDNSWIRNDDDDYEAVDRDPNFGSSVLSHYRSTESLNSPVAENKQITRSTSVQALTKRFSGSQDELPNSSYTTSRVSHTQSSPTYRRTDEPESSTTTTVSKDGKITETTTFTTSQSLRSPTKTFSERVQSFTKGAEDKLYDTLIPNAIKDEDSGRSLSSSETMTLRRSINGAEDELYDTLLPKGIASAQPSSYSSSSVTSKRELVTVESSVGPLSSLSSLHSTSYSDEIPSARITSYSTSSSLPNDNYSSKSGSYYYSSSSSSSSKPGYEYSGIGSPTEYSSATYRSSSSRSDNMLSTPVTSVKSVYNTSDRTVLERELCTYCHKPFNGDPKMILDDMKISCHTFCFKCEVCNGSLGHLKAGDCMWVYNSMVHCENCFDVTREKWRR